MFLRKTERKSKNGLEKERESKNGLETGGEREREKERMVLEKREIILEKSREKECGWF